MFFANTPFAPARTKRRRAAPSGLGMALAIAGWLAWVPAQSATLTVCVSEDNAPLSFARQGEVKGFDVVLAQAIAQDMGRTLRVVPFESEIEKETMLTHEVNALLSAGICDLASGFPLLASDLGAPSRPRFKTPDYPGAKRMRDRPFVELGTLVASRPYQGTAISVVQRANQGPVKALSDLRDRKVGAVAGTLEGAMVAMYRNGYLRDSMVSLSQREDTWGALESGRVDALLVASTAFDAYLQRAKAADLRAADFQRSIGINLGFVALSDRIDVLDATNRVIERTQANGQMVAWAQEAGMRWQAPSAPAIANGLSLPTLLLD